MRKGMLCLGLALLGSQETRAQGEWVARYNRQLYGMDEARAIRVDGSGNVYVTGWSFDDYATIKYDGSTGDELWVRSYSGPGAWSGDYATALAVDGSGNVYVTGYSGSNPNYDYATLKYSSSGTNLWVKRYNGPSNLRDEARAIDIDGFGYVYVTGYSWSATGRDYTTIKYNSMGDTSWVRRYDGGNHDEANDIAISGSGNIYITGSSWSLADFQDYATVGYSSNGDTLWVRRYNGPGDSLDWANALAVDDFGNIYVTGYSWGGSSFDFATIKYNGSTGNVIWVKSYDGASNSDDRATAIAVDDSENIYVTGYSLSGTSYDYLTIKYSSSGNALWVKGYNASGNSSDQATALAVDDFGNVYVTGVSGSDYATLKYDGSTGDSLWVRRYDVGFDAGNALAVDGFGNVHVTGRSSNDYATIKYSSIGDSLWVKRYNPFRSGDDEAHALAVDGSGNVCVTGYSWNGSYSEYTTIKYDGTTGDTLWVNFEAGLGDTSRAIAVDVDGSGNVYVTGNSWNGSSMDYATVKYNGSTGNLLWRMNYDGFGYDDARALVVDGSGDVFVTGWSVGGGSDIDYATIKYDGSTGNLLWERRYDGAGNGIDLVTAIAIDGSANVYVTGSSWNGSSNDYLTIKYDGATGNPIWEMNYDGFGNGNDLANALAVNDSGDVFVTGWSVGVGSGIDYATIKYDGAFGFPIWESRNNGPANSDDQATALGVDGSGNVYVTGSSWNGTSTDYTTIKYNGATGDTLWVKRYDGFGLEDSANAIAVDVIGNVYVTGTSSSFSSNDYVTIKYSSLGDSLWVKKYDGQLFGNDQANAIALDGSGNVFVTGGSEGGGMDFATLKYCFKDIGTLSLPLPPDTVLTDSTYSPQAWVRNGGGCLQIFDVIATIDGYGDTQVVSLAQGDSALVTFAPWTVPSSDSTFYSMTVCTETPSDEDNTNNCASKPIFAYSPVGIEESLKIGLPTRFSLSQNNPNPFHSTTLIHYTIPMVGARRAVPLRLEIYDISGRLVHTLVDGLQEPGVYQLPISNHQLPGSGVYFYRLQAGDFIETKKTVLLR